MWNWKKWIWPGVLTIVVLALLANWLRGDAIEADLTAKADRLLKSDHPWATVELDRRDLTLRGFAPSPQAAKSALDIARNAYDVRVVINASEPLAAASPYRFKATRSGKEIKLSGNAPDHQTREAISAAAKKAVRRAKVEGELELASGAPQDFAAAAEYALGLLPELEGGEVDLQDKTLSVSGSTRSLEDFDAVLERASVLPEGYELSENTILPPPVSPYRWSISKQATGVTLRGNAPSYAAKDESIANARERMGGVEIRDRQVVASGDPSGSGEVRELLNSLVARLDAGQGNMVDQTVSG